MKNFYFILKYLTFALLLSSCSKWGVVGPERLVGDTELKKVAEIEISPFVNKLIYSEPYLLALTNSKGYLINLTNFSKPFVEDSINILYLDKIAFDGKKIFHLQYRPPPTLIIVYNILVRPIEIDTFTYETFFFEMLLSKGNIFLRKDNGFIVLNANSMNIVFSYTISDSSVRSSSKIFIDNDYFYYLSNTNTCLVFSHGSTDSIEFIKSYYFDSQSSELVSIRQRYMLFLDSQNLIFEYLDNSEIEMYTLPGHPYITIWDSDFIFAARFVSSTNSQVLMFGAPYLQRKKILCELELTGRIRTSTSLNDYLFCHSENYQTEDSKLLIYKIIKYDRPWEK